MRSKKRKIAMYVFGISMLNQTCPSGTCALPRTPLPRKTGGAHGARNAGQVKRLESRKDSID